MRKKIAQDAAFEVATQVRTVEDSLDSTLQELAELQCAMIRARRATHASVITGQNAFEELGATIQTLITARGTIGRCHAELRSATLEIPGLRELGMGDVGECPPPPSAEIAPLRVVA